MSCNWCNWRETAIAVANEFSAAKAEFEQQLGEVEAKAEREHGVAKLLSEHAARLDDQLITERARADRLAKLLGKARRYVEGDRDGYGEMLADIDAALSVSGLAEKEVGDGNG